jgi:hypothetical protein
MSGSRGIGLPARAERGRAAIGLPPGSVPALDVLRVPAARSAVPPRGKVPRKKVTFTPGVVVAVILAIFLPRKTLSMVAGKRGDDLRDLVDLEERGWRVITNLDPQR